MFNYYNINLNLIFILIIFLLGFKICIYDFIIAIIQYYPGLMEKD